MLSPFPPPPSLMATMVTTAMMTVFPTIGIFEDDKKNTSLSNPLKKKAMASTLNFQNIILLQLNLTQLTIKAN